MLGQQRQRVERRAHGGQLELVQEPDLVGLREPAHGAARRRAVEAGQRLRAHGRAGEGADRLEDRVHDVVVQRVSHALLATARAVLGAPAGVQQAGKLLDDAAGHLRGEAALPVGGALDRGEDRVGEDCP